MANSFQINKASITYDSGISETCNYITIENSDFTVENAKTLFDFSKDNSTLILVPIAVKDIITSEDEVYNEEYLAQLRQILLLADENLKISFMPITKDVNNTEYDYLISTATMKHTARRLKKFTCITGFTLSFNETFKNEKTRQYFISELSQKHDYKFITQIN